MTINIKTTYKYSIFWHTHQAVILPDISAYFLPIWIPNTASLVLHKQKS